MTHSIFYSWQSDSDASTNRNLIEVALKRALQRLKKDATVTIDPVLDRDTSGLAGSPSITEAIFSKITMADVFVADVTIVNPRAKGRRTPNPNVLVELGFAVSTIGWEQIVLVQNISNSSQEALPFDLRGRRVVAYDAKPGAVDLAEARTILAGKLELALKAALTNSLTHGVHAGQTVPLWWGIWRTQRSGPTSGGELFIREVGSSGFLFDISVYSGAHSGFVTGFARFASSDLAYARIVTASSTEQCDISFRRSLVDGVRAIDVQEGAGCWYFHGAGVRFTKAYVRVWESLFENGLLDELDLQRLHSITGQYFEHLTQHFQSLSDQENVDPFPARVVAGAPRGLFTIAEAIVMRGNDGQLWAAFIDGEHVRYFTTERAYADRLPLTLERWRSRFPSKEVIYQSDVERIPKRVT